MQDVVRALGVFDDDLLAAAQGLFRDRRQLRSLEDMPEKISGDALARRVGDGHRMHVVGEKTDKRSVGVHQSVQHRRPEFHRSVDVTTIEVGTHLLENLVRRRPKFRIGHHASAVLVTGCRAPLRGRSGPERRGCPSHPVVPDETGASRGTMASARGEAPTASSCRSR